MKKFRPLWEGGKNIGKINAKISYQIRLFCVRELTNICKKNPGEFDENEKGELVKMINELKQEKKNISPENQNCEIQEYEIFLNKFFEQLEYEEKNETVTLNTCSKFRLMASFIDVLSFWGPINEPMLKRKKYCLKKCADIFNSLKKVETSKIGEPREGENELKTTIIEEKKETLIINNKSAINEEKTEKDENSSNKNISKVELLIMKYKEKLTNLENKLKEEKAKNKELESNYNNQILELKEEIRIKDNELNEIKSQLPFDLLKGEKIMTVIFTSVDQKVHYSVICKNTDVFSRLENEIYKEEDYEKYKDKNSIFIINGKVINNKNETLEQIGITNNSIIIINVND